MRLDKLLVKLKYGTRSEVQKKIKSKEVKVNNKPITEVGKKIDPDKDLIYLNDELIFYKSEINLALYKPKGYLSANFDPTYPTVIDLIKPPYQRQEFKIAGRLDLDSEGLLILTTLGKLAHEITSPNKEVSKIYEVTLEKEITKTDLEKLLKPHYLRNSKKELYESIALSVTYLEPKKVLVEINMGKYHQVKKMFIYLDNRVTNLKRIQIGKLKLGDLKPGQYIEFKKEELLWILN